MKASASSHGYGCQFREARRHCSLSLWQCDYVSTHNHKEQAATNLPTVKETPDWK